MDQSYDRGGSWKVCPGKLLRQLDKIDAKGGGLIGFFTVVTPVRTLTVFLVLLATFSARAEDAAAAMRLLKSNCFSCHNEDKHKGGLVMTSREGILKGGENGEGMVVGEP